MRFFSLDWYASILSLVNSPLDEEITALETSTNNEASLLEGSIFPKLFDSQKLNIFKIKEEGFCLSKFYWLNQLQSHAKLRHKIIIIGVL